MYITYIACILVAIKPLKMQISPNFSLYIISPQFSPLPPQRSSQILVYMIAKLILGHFIHRCAMRHVALCVMYILICHTPLPLNEMDVGYSYDSTYRPTSLLQDKQPYSKMAKGIQQIFLQGRYTHGQ